MSDRKAQGIEATNQAFRRTTRSRSGRSTTSQRRITPRPSTRRPASRPATSAASSTETRPTSKRSRTSWAMRCAAWASPSWRGTASTPRSTTRPTRGSSSCSPRSSLEEKLRYRASRFGSVNQGYFPIKETSDIHPDLVEGWVFCRRAFDLDDDPAYREDDFWPRPGHEPFFRRVCQAHERLILPVMQSLLRPLGCDPHLYDRRLAGTNFGLRLNHYPPMSAADEALGRRPHARPRGRRPVHLPPRLPGGGSADPEPGQREVDPARRAAGLDHPQHRRLRAAHLERHLPLHDAPGEPAPRRRRAPSGRGSRSRWRSTSGRTRCWRSCPVSSRGEYEPIKAIHFHTRITSKYYGDDYAVG